MSRVQRPEIALGTGWCLQKRCWPAHYSDFDATMLHMGIVEKLVLDKMPVKHAQWSAFDRSGDPSNWHICGLLRAPKCRCRNNSWSHPPFLTPSSFLPPCLPISCPESDEVWGREPERIIGPKSAKFLHKHCKRTAVNSHFELNTWSDGEYWA